MGPGSVGWIGESDRIGAVSTTATIVGIIEIGAVAGIGTIGVEAKIDEIATAYGIGNSPTAAKLPITSSCGRDKYDKLNIRNVR
ncbi:hypothetical protein [Natronobacterium lacisalsi]|uniref:hypothetical protein n=1 Tax=Natronobacterium lacisalsi TaxID=229731 RepID=UPI00126869E9|nr:hypothetical protein [Halobiforma lacisalsi]